MVSIPVCLTEDRGSIPRVVEIVFIQQPATIFGINENRNQY